MDADNEQGGDERPEMMVRRVLEQLTATLKPMSDLMTAVKGEDSTLTVRRKAGVVQHNRR